MLKRTLYQPNCHYPPSYWSAWLFSLAGVSQKKLWKIIVLLFVMNFFGIGVQEYISYKIFNIFDLHSSFTCSRVVQIKCPNFLGIFACELCWQRSTCGGCFLLGINPIFPLIDCIFILGEIFSFPAHVQNELPKSHPRWYDVSNNPPPAFLMLSGRPSHNIDKCIP